MICTSRTIIFRILISFTTAGYSVFFCLCLCFLRSTCFFSYHLARTHTCRFVLKTEDIVFNKTALQGLGLLQPLEEGEEVLQEEQNEGQKEGRESHILGPTELAAGRKVGASTAIAAAVVTITLRQMESHGDQVLLLPPGAVPLASSGKGGDV